MFEARPTDDVQADGPLLVNSPNLGPVGCVPTCTYPVAGMRWASPFEWLYTIGLRTVWPMTLSSSPVELSLPSRVVHFEHLLLVDSRGGVTAVTAAPWMSSDDRPASSV